MTAKFLSASTGGNIVDRLLRWLGVRFEKQVSDWYDDDWKNYEFNMDGDFRCMGKPIGYYEYPGSWATCGGPFGRHGGCGRITRKILKNGKEASRCEHCGTRGYWVA